MCLKFLRKVQQFSWSSRKTRHNQSNYWWIKNNLPKKKHLYCTIDELFNLFKEKYSNIKIIRSKFAELRPPYALPPSAMPTCACVCHYHENFKLLLDELHKVNKTIPTYLKEFVNSLVCNPESKLCWKNLGLLCGKKMSATQQL